jgi:hypothetical protein
MKAKIATETIYYILKKLNKADKLQIVKLIYLADKYHLLLYGRTITGDQYFAVKHGPMGSMVDDVLNFNEDILGENDLAFANKLIERKNLNTYLPKNVENEFEMLSESDKKALDFIIQKFGKEDMWKLKDYTHKYPEWKRYEKLFENQTTTREDIKTEDLISILPDNIFNIPQAHIEVSRALLTGMLE